MRQLIAVLVVFGSLATTGLAAQDTEPVTRSPEYLDSHANQEGMAIEPARDSAAQGQLAGKSSDELEQQKQDSGVRKAVVIGAAVGAAVFVGFLVFIATAMN